MSKHWVACLLVTHQRLCNMMRTVVPPTDTKVDAVLHELITENRHFGWAARMLITLLILCFIYLVPKRRSTQRAVMELRRRDSRWQPVSDANHLLQHLANDLMHEIDVPIAIRLHCFEYLVELAEILSPLPAADIATTGRPEVMQQLSQGEMWVRIGQRQRRLKGGANPIWHPGTFEYTLLHDHNLRRVLQLENPMVRAILRKWDWLKVFRMRQRVTLWAERWADWRYRHHVFRGAWFFRLQVLSESLLLWISVAIATYYVLGPP